MIAGGDVPQGNWSEEATEAYTIPIYSNGTEENALYGYTNIARVQEDSVTISARGTIGYTAIREAPFYPIVRLIVATPDTERIKLKYLYGVLKQTEFQQSGKTIPQLTVPMVRDVKIPVPPLEVQQKIIDECEAIEKKIAAAEEKLESLKGKTAEILRKYLS
ncbi:MAG: restriction endonuclease subunit S [Synergistaceae bacterium]|nr:restriction endonuclease subunit S [Synergistaceae bacterium]